VRREEREEIMKEENKLRESDDEELRQDEQIPVMQRVLDNPFLLLFLGITVPTVFYIIWGVMEIITIPLAP
jgi:hypothetical protein